MGKNKNTSQASSLKSHEKGYFRPNVAAIVINAQGKILIASRLDYPQSWQFPQGGIDKGESEEEAVIRETSEELGIHSVRILRKCDRMHQYCFENKPPFRKALGQRQRYFLLEFYGPDSEITLINGKHHEFSSWKWIDPEDFPISTVYKPKREIYRDVLEYFFEVRLSISP